MRRVVVVVGGTLRIVRGRGRRRVRMVVGRRTFDWGLWDCFWCGGMILIQDDELLARRWGSLYRGIGVMSCRYSIVRLATAFGGLT